MAFGKLKLTLEDDQNTEIEHDYYSYLTPSILSATNETRNATKFNNRG